MLRLFRHPSCLLLTAAAWLGLFSPALLAVDFDRDIQPLLTAKCLPCHGQSEPEAGLRMTSREGAIAALESGKQAIVPGKAAESELMRRVSSQDAAERMPPKGEPLSAMQIAALREWIDGGAVWPEHWAYRPLVAFPPLPLAEGRSEGHATPIDAFVLFELKSRGLTPAAAADQRTLLRRVYFDLSGLPPTPEEMAAFQGDEAPDAYERIVDRLLASPRHGERWARHWMDVVHYAETHGHDQDRPRENAWPYRDFLIRSLNRDIPYATFVQQQIAGDVLWPDDPQAIAATGLLATGPWDESSLQSIREDAIDRQIARYIDRDDVLTTVVSTFLSTTVHCARCHDHKFDPIHQKDYYNLQAVFAATEKADRAFDADPKTASRRTELLSLKESLTGLREKLDASLLTPELHADIVRWEVTVASAESVWQVAEVTEVKADSGTTLTKQADGSYLAGGMTPEKETYTFTIPLTGKPLTGLKLEVLLDTSLPKQGPGRQPSNGNLHLNEVVVKAAPQSDPSKKSPVVLQNAKADFDQAGWTIAMAIDGNPDTAWGVDPQEGKPHQALFEFKTPLSTEGGVLLTIELKQLHGRQHTIGRPRLSLTNAPLPLPLDVAALPQPVAAAIAVPPAERTNVHKADLAQFYLSQQYDRDLAALPQQQMVYAGTSQLKPADKPRTIHLLKRGDINQPLEEAQPAALAFLQQLPANLRIEDLQQEGQRRAALARWTSDEKNALAWRSIANRVWHYHFGRGIVDTPSDFGKMGSPPTHPQLLDWLALELQTSGGSLKTLHRRIVTSGAYRQSSAHNPKNAEIDADNKYLWRMHRSRLEAEQVHDALVQIAGSEDLAMGGKSVRQFIQTPGIHVTPNVDYQNFNPDDAANYRRSVYRFVFRTLPDPFMESLDCADASQLTPARTVSVTALQALTMLNDKFVIRQSERLAERLKAEAGENQNAQVARLFELILLRPPRESEATALRAYLEKHGLSNACRLLLNSNEFMFVN
ncbi:MAG: PSD1 and planctomycete cytochrome C domain-containing protein [Pirellulaceae bacterium]